MIPEAKERTNILKKILAAACAALTLTLAGCSFSGGESYNVMHEYNFAEMELVQLQPPEIGDTIAVFDTSMGEIRAVLYEEYAPNYVAAFIEKAKSGAYDNMDVYGIQRDVFLLTGGKENADKVYIGRESDDELIANECNVNLWPFRGALVAFSEKPGFSDARYFIVNTDTETVTPEAIESLKKSVEKREDPKERQNLLELFDKFLEIGGAFGTAGTYPVFGQSYYGLDVIEKICAVPTDDTGRPNWEVTINSVTIGEFTEEDKALMESAAEANDSAENAE